ncbi:MAG: 4-hydroxybenzoate decarboxylase [Planctomycetes bacterium]|nr:4-hydroxybenzoate decarboxylase [Planctomycetota bacterium]
MAAANSFPDLGSFIDALRVRSDLVEIPVEVDSDLELAEIHRRVIAAGGPALLFRHVKGSTFPVVSNLFGTRERVLLAFGERPRELVSELARVPQELLPPTPGRLWKKRGLLWSIARTGLKRGASGPVLEVNDGSPDLSTVPMTRSWSKDGGAFLTLGLVYTEHPRTGEHNLGLYRMQRHDETRLGMHWQIGKGGGFHYAEAEAAAQPLPVNVFLGGPPAAILSAIAPMPENVPELLLASLVRGGKVRMANNPAGPLPVLADAEFTLVGEVPAKERMDEGPFGDHYGYYSLKHPFPYFRTKALLRRKAPVLPVTVVGKPRQEDFFIGDFLQEMLSPLFPVVMPGVRDLWSYGETGYHSLSAAVVRERYKREAMASAFRILGEGQLSLTKFLLVLDKSVDLRDFAAVLEHVLARADFRTDLYVMGNLSMDTLDYAGPRINEGSKGVLLGLGDPIRDLPRSFAGPQPDGVNEVRVFCPGCLVVSGPSFLDGGTFAERLTRDPAVAAWPLIVLVDDAEQATRSAMNFLWTTFTRFDPASDIHARGVDLLCTHASFQPPVLIDARMKPSYPEELFCDDQTAEKVTKRWGEYFPSGMDMGDSARAHLD